MKKYAVPIALFAAFEAVAITLWLTKGNPFYLFNFTYIGACAPWMSICSTTHAAARTAPSASYAWSA